MFSFTIRESSELISNLVSVGPSPMMVFNTFITNFYFVWLLVLIQNLTNVRSFQCGVPYRGKGLIHNGKETNRHEHPWKVALFDVSKGQEYFCGGVLIDDETILTAAHCLDQYGGRTLKPTDISVLLGAHNIDQQSEIGRTVFSAELIYIHDKWNSTSLKFKNDVALIKLNETVNFNQFIQPVCLPTSTEITTIDNGTVVGWGHYNDNEKISNYPREVEVPILDPFDCLVMNIYLVHIFDRTSMFCGGRENIGVCQGDSGSGFYVEKDGIFYVRGIVSSGAGKICSSMNYLLYSDVLSNWKFIKENVMNEKVDAECSDSWGRYRCDIENLEVNRPNFRIGRINTHHKQGKSDQDVELISIEKSNFTFLPTFQNGYLEQKFINAKGLCFWGSNQPETIPLSLAKTSIVPEHIERFEMNKFGKRLTHLPANMLHGALKLSIFVVNDNNFEEISEDFFSKNIELEGVDLQNNAIKSLPEGLWEHNLKLSQIHISGNRLKIFPQKLLKNLVNLADFAATNNKIEIIPYQFFHSNEKLEKVYLYGNQITSLPDNLFSNSSRNLKLLTIRGNNITSLPSKLIANAPLLESFEINYNKISDISAKFFSQNSKLRFLRIDGNRLTTFPQSLLNNLVNLTYFDASENEIESIPEFFFHNNEKLKSLYLHGNKINSLYDNLFANNKNLDYVDIGNNRITHLPPNLIANCPLLRYFKAQGAVPENFRMNNPKLWYFNT